MHSTRKILIDGIFIVGKFLGAIALSLLLAELQMRILSPPNPFVTKLPLIPNIKKQIHSEKLQGVSADSIHSTNSWGMRGDEPPRDWKDFLTIVAIGNSTTESFYIDDKKIWTYLLQQNLTKKNNNVWVGNAGIDGASTRSHILLMNDIIAKIRPNIVLFFIGMNDLSLSIDKDAIAEDTKTKPALTSLEKIESYSRLVQLILLWKHITFDKATVVDTVYHGNFQAVPMSLPDEPLPNPIRNALPLFPEYPKNIHTLIAQAKKIQTRPIFMTQPILFEDTPYWSTIQANPYWIPNPTTQVSGATMYKFLAEYNTTLLQICKEEHVECIDVASQIPHSNDYFYDSIHLTENGQKAVADIVTRYLEEKR